MSPATSIVRCAVLFIAVCHSDSLTTADESELKRESKIAGFEEMGTEWGEKGNFEDVSEPHGAKRNDYGMERDGM